MTHKASFTGEGQPTFLTDEPQFRFHLPETYGLRWHQWGWVGVCRSWDSNDRHSWFTRWQGLPDRLKCRRRELEQCEGSAPAAPEPGRWFEQPSSTSSCCKQIEKLVLYNKQHRTLGCTRNITRTFSYIMMNNKTIRYTRNGDKIFFLRQTCLTSSFWLPWPEIRCANESNTLKNEGESHENLKKLR